MFIKFQKYSIYDSEENEGGLHLPLPQLEAWTRFNIYFSLQQRKKPRGCNSSQQNRVTFWKKSRTFHRTINHTSIKIKIVNFINISFSRNVEQIKKKLNQLGLLVTISAIRTHFFLHSHFTYRNTRHETRLWQVKQ